MILTQFVVGFTAGFLFANLLLSVYILFDLLREKIIGDLQ
jgi:tetrahydromethanopterin S-methyltransferase subunit F